MVALMDLLTVPLRSENFLASTETKNRLKWMHGRRDFINSFQPRFISIPSELQL